MENIEDIRRVTKLSLLKIGMRCDFSGFNYLSYAIELVIQNPELINSLCTNLYVQIGEHFGVKNISCVERSMRHAISNIETIGQSAPRSKALRGIWDRSRICKTLV